MRTCVHKKTGACAPVNNQLKINSTLKPYILVIQRHTI